MKVSSPAFTNNAAIPAEYTCDGKGKNPPILVSDVRDGVKSLVLIVDDPDAPMGLFTHWVVWNIPPETQEIAEDTMSSLAKIGRNSAGEVGWIAPCPPNGLHHYRFQVFALSELLSVPEGSERDSVEREMEKRVIERAELVGEYQRQDRVSS